jgi:glycosyltransferase involved in cell wall biosynthesis
VSFIHERSINIYAKILIFDLMKHINISVIISTYNSPEWLEKVLWSYNFQSYKDFEVVIADDGSGEATREVIELMKTKVDYPIQHVWHPDKGFQKTIILNKATLASKADYLLYTDGDCIARNDFLQVHYERRQVGAFEWLKSKGLKSSFKTYKITSNGVVALLLNTFTPTKATWNGHNVSGWREDIINANGYDERMQYGGEDRELGERLRNAGVKGKQIRYSAICLHLDHDRGYVKPEMLERNKQIRASTRENKTRRTLYGIIK